MYLEKSSTVSVVVGLVCIGLMYRYRVLIILWGFGFWATYRNFACLHDFFDDVHLAPRTFFSHSSPPTGPPITKPTPFDRGHSNAGIVAEFRDSYPQGPEIFKLQWVGDPIHFGKMLINI